MEFRAPTAVVNVALVPCNPIKGAVLTRDWVRLQLEFADAVVARPIWISVNPQTALTGFRLRTSALVALADWRIVEVVWVLFWPVAVERFWLRRLY